MKRWRAVVFDLDDTLYPERDYVLSGFRAVSQWAEQNLGVPADGVYSALETLYTSGVRGDTFDRWLTATDLPLELVPTLLRVYREHRPVLRPFPGIEELLAELQEQHLLGLVTDGHLRVQETKLSALGLSQYFESIVFSDTWGRQAWKPSTRPFIEVTGQLGIAPGDAVYVADNPTKDFRGARDLGLSTIWCRYSNGDYCRLAIPSAAHAPDCTVDSLADLENHLLSA